MERNMFEIMIKEHQKQELEKILSYNQTTAQYGLKLSEQDTLALLQSRKISLKEQERIEFGEGILSKLITAFCDSPYIYQDNYVEVLEQLQAIFYEYKNETLDELPDDELIELMKNYFDGECQGSIEFLEETCLEKLAGEIRGRYDEDGASRKERENIELLNET